MGKGLKWSVVMAAALFAGAAGASDRGEFQLTPYVGLSQVKVDGRYLEFGESEDYGGLVGGISAGYRAPFGLVVEIGTAAFGEPATGWVAGGNVRELYGAVGYDFELGKDWRLTPKIGLTKWRLSGSELQDLVDGSGELRESLDGEDASLEIAVTKRFNSHIGIGFSLRHSEVEFGQASSAAFQFIWSL